MQSASAAVVISPSQRCIIKLTIMSQHKTNQKACQTLGTGVTTGLSTLSKTKASVALAGHSRQQEHLKGLTQLRLVNLSPSLSSSWWTVIRKATGATEVPRRVPSTTTHISMLSWKKTTLTKLRMSLAISIRLRLRKSLTLPILKSSQTTSHL